MKLFGTLTNQNQTSFLTSSDNKTVTITPTSTLTGASLTLTLPNPSTTTDVLISRTSTDTLTNKTLTAPIIATISNTGTLTLPTSTDTLVGRATTDTLTNKTLTSPVLTTPSVTTAATFSAQAEARFADSDSSNYVGFKSPATVAANKIWTLPTADGSTGQVLQTDGSLALSWATALTNPQLSGFVVDGSADEIQWRVQGHSTQTTDIAVVEKSDGTDLLQVTNVNGTHIRGTTTNDAAASGFVGQEVITTVNRADTGLSNGVIADVAVLNVPAGDWEISGQLMFKSVGAVAITQLIGWIQPTGTTIPSTADYEIYPMVYQTGYTITPSTDDLSYPLAPIRVSLAAATDYYLSTRLAFSGGTSIGAYGRIRARRIR